MKKMIGCCAFSLLFTLGLMADTAETIPFITLMQPGNETPAITDTSSGNVIIWVHVIRDSSGKITSGSVDFDVSTKFSSAVTVTGLHIHKAPAGTAGAIVIPTDVNSSDKKIDIDATGRLRIQKQVQFPQTAPAVDIATVQDMIDNPQNYYANIHTTVNPSGAMRGQLLKAEMKVVMGLMSPKNEVPPTPVTASGIASVTLLRAKDSGGNVVAADAVFNLDYTGFDTGTVFTGFHIHNGGAGINGPVIINTGIAGGANSVNADASGAGNLNYLVPMTPLDSSFANEVGTVNGIFNDPTPYYINIHTTIYGGGVMRDQLRNTEKSVFQVNMVASNETPPIAGLTANAQTDLPIYILRNPDGTVAAGAIVFDVNFRGFPAGTTFTGLHVHQAAAGTAGGIVFPSGVDANANKVVSDTGNGNIFRIVNISSPAGITALNAFVQNPANFYANLHTTVNPGGAVRDQLAAPLAKPVITGIAANASTITSAAPGSIISIYGTNLSPLASDLSGFATTITSLATAMNGVSVTVGGVKAPIYAAYPGQVNVQVPVEVAAGSQAVVVTTSAGASAPMNVTVASAAPAIFVLDAASGLGTIVKNDDFTLITSTNKVKAGDTIVIYSTGLGQTTPAITTGGLLVPPAGGFNSTGTVKVTIGGQNAPIVYSIASPGFAGLYQTAVTVPAGVTGTAKVVLTSGTTDSNSVNIAVQ
ncbi:MAG TPA: CHRD domain-containing protein [Bryobacteraceae bacterium]